MEDAELGWREPDVSAVPGDLLDLRLNVQRADFQRGLRLLELLIAGASKDRANTHRELLRRKRVNNVVVSAEGEGLEDARLVVPAGKHDDRSGISLAHALKQREAILLRQTEIEHEQIRTIHFQSMQRLTSVRRFDDHEPFAAQRVRRHVEEIGIVFDEQDLQRASPST